MSRHWTFRRYGSRGGRRSRRSSSSHPGRGFPGREWRKEATRDIASRVLIIASCFTLSDCITVILVTGVDWMTGASPREARAGAIGGLKKKEKKSQQREVRNKLRSTRYAFSERGSYRQCGSVGHQRGKSPFNKRAADFYGSRVRAWKLFLPFFPLFSLIARANISSDRVTPRRFLPRNKWHESNCFRWLIFWKKKFFFL